ncbi:hypothetical protein BJ165DRAFT_1405231 [Panaeolus papilionaceus]|nr:hypothetical protein BJ165DRAFT_1405231 [Panaeolus papilionaceus]
MSRDLLGVGYQVCVDCGTKVKLHLHREPPEVDIWVDMQSNPVPIPVGFKRNVGTTWSRENDVAMFPISKFLNWSLLPLIALRDETPTPLTISESTARLNDVHLVNVPEQPTLEKFSLDVLLEIMAYLEWYDILQLRQLLACVSSPSWENISPIPGALATMGETLDIPESSLLEQVKPSELVQCMWLSSLDGQEESRTKIWYQLFDEDLFAIAGSQKNNAKPPHLRIKQNLRLFGLMVPG